MFRTRDFILLFSLVAFLLIGITFTVLTNQNELVTTASQIEFAEVYDGDYVALIDSEEPFSREDRVDKMKQKIADEGVVIISAPIEEIIEEEVDEEKNERGVQIENRCLGYSAYLGTWSPLGVKIEVLEGARLVYRDILLPTVPVVLSTTSSSTVAAKVQRETLLQLPVKAHAVADDSCIDSDVIGIALEGSLIRNNEVYLYGSFGPGTLIGYALDGFPIYGVSSVTGDECGGIQIGTQYRYQVSVERETILNCFSAPPVNF